VIEIEAVHAWGKEERELDPEIAAALNATGALKAVIVKAPNLWRIEADSRVGIIVGDGWEIRILPHLKIPKLGFLLAYSLRPDGWHDAVTAMSEERDVIEALAAGFASHCERALDRGLLRGYVEVEERRNDLRGRIRFGDQLARLPGLPLPLEVSYDDFTADIPENRLLLTAAETLLRFPRIPPRARARLLHVRAVLDEVEVIADHRRVELPEITRLNERYQSALVLGKLILDGTGLRQERGLKSTTSFLFDLNEVFESFVYQALRDSLRRFGGTVERQVSGALDVGRAPGLSFRADIVWRKRGVVRAVIDSKYKSLYAASSMPNGDAYQMLAYCIGFGVPRGVLVYARDTLDRPRLHEIKRHGYEIDVRAVDVELEPDEVLKQIDRIATAIAGGAKAPSLLSAVALGTRHS
jgi:5-methylcytosine-specific restriction enzyme subunit McrC